MALPATTELPPVLALLDGWVRDDPAPAGFDAVISVAVTNGDEAPICWYAVLSASGADCGVRDTVPSDTDALVVMDAQTAHSIVHKAALGGPVKHAGDAKLMKRFVQRYCAPTNAVSVRFGRRF